MNIYICASFCYEDKKKTSERKYIIEKTVERIQEQLGDNHHYYIPHKLTIPNAWDISMEEWAKAVFETDMMELDLADLIIFLSFGKENNAGSVWEIGYTVGKGAFRQDDDIQKVVMVKMTNDFESLMLTNSLDRIISEKEIETYDWNNLPHYKTQLDKLS